MRQMALNESLRSIEAEIAAGRIERGFAICQDVQTRYPRALAAQRALGELYLAQRKTREAIGALDRALAGNPEDARACCARAIVQQIQGASLAALEWYRRACDTIPDDQVLLSAYRELAAHLGQAPYRPSRYGLGRLYLRGELYRHAIHEFEGVLAERPDALEAQVGLAEALWRERQFGAAQERCRRILANVPSCLKATLILAYVEFEAGHEDEARRLAQRAAELDPDHRMSQMLFADELAGGNSALSLLLFGAEAPMARPTTSVSLGSGGAMTQQRASQAQLPTGQPLTGPLVGSAQAGLAAQAAQGGQRLFAQSQSQPIGTQGPGRGTPEVPTERMPSVAPQPGRAAPLPGSITGGPGLQAPQARPSTLPADFHSIFAETEYMLWGRDEDGFPIDQRATSTQPTVERGRADPFARSGTFVPPALRQQGANLDETEARAAINWVNWLQAQGARSSRDAGTPNGQYGAQGPRPQSGLLPPLPPANAGRPFPPNAPSPAGAQSAASVDADATGRSGTGTPWEALTGALPPPLAFEPPVKTIKTGPLAAPTSSALRAMFAELQPEASANRVVEGEVAPAPLHAEQAEDGAFSVADVAQDAYQDAHQDMRQGQGAHQDAQYTQATGYGAFDAQGAAMDGQRWSNSGALERGWSVEDREAEVSQRSAGSWLDDAEGALGAAHANVGVAGGDAAPSWAARYDGGADGGQGGSQPMTLEELDRGLEERGFAAIELRADALATLSQQDTRARDETGYGAGGAVAAEPEPEASDYPGRLTRARQQREQGQLDEALVEYRHILRNAPDLLGEVVADLQTSMSETPDHPEIHRLLGDARIRQGDYLSALESYNRAVALTQAQGS